MLEGRDDMSDLAEPRTNLTVLNYPITICTGCTLLQRWSCITIGTSNNTFTMGKERPYKDNCSVPHSLLEVA
jgi:hypothetical protein